MSATPDQVEEQRQRWELFAREQFTNQFLHTPKPVERHDFGFVVNGVGRVAYGFFPTVEGDGVTVVVDVAGNYVFRLADQLTDKEAKAFMATAESAQRNWVEFAQVAHGETPRSLGLPDEVQDCLTDVLAQPERSDWR